MAVDLAPGPAGKWGQIIIFGRDYDCKYVVARSWAAFLATVADDLATEKWSVEEESGELTLREFKAEGVEPPYLEVLRWRVDQRVGRRGGGGGGKRRGGPPNGLGVRTDATLVPGGPSPVEERGRSPLRWGERGGLAALSPRAGAGLGKSPLSQVEAETLADAGLGGEKVGLVMPGMSPGLGVGEEKPLMEREGEVGESVEMGEGEGGVEKENLKEGGLKEVEI